jgi:hypothetical protein
VAGLSRPPAHGVVQHVVGRVAMKYMKLLFFSIAAADRRYFLECFYAFLGAYAKLVRSDC